MKNNPKKGQIIKTAQRRFSRHGLTKTTMEEIARDLRMGKATLYHYFKSKEEIFYEATKLEIERYKTELKLIIDDEESDIEKKQLDYLKFKECIDEKFPILFELITQIIKNVAYEKEIFFFNRLIAEESKLVQTIFTNGTNEKNHQQKVVISVQLSWLFPYLNKIKQVYPGHLLNDDSVYPLGLFS